MRIFDKLPLANVALEARESLYNCCTDQTAYRDEVVLSTEDVKAGWRRVQNLADGEPVKEAVRQAAVLCGVVSGEPSRDFFVDGFDRVPLADLAPPAKAVAAFVDANQAVLANGHTMPGNQDAALDRNEVRRAIEELNYSTLSEVQKGYLGRFGKLFGLEQVKPLPRLEELPAPTCPFTIDSSGSVANSDPTVGTYSAAKLADGRAWIVHRGFRTDAAELMTPAWIREHKDIVHLLSNELYNNVFVDDKRWYSYLAAHVISR